MKRCYILCRDARFDALSEIIRRDGAEILTELCASPAPAAFYLPLTAKDEALLQTLAAAPAASLVVAGKATDETKAAFSRKGVELILLLENEIYRRRNAAATAEGALCEAIARIPRTLAGQSCLVAGYGACGAALSRLFSAVGCRVFVFSHESSLQRAVCDGYLPCRDPEKEAARFDLVLNTIPAPALSEAFCRALAPKAVFFQIATDLSGLAPALFEERGVLFCPLPGLPGRYAPQTEAETIDWITRPYRTYQKRE